MICRLFVGPRIRSPVHVTVQEMTPLDSVRRAAASRSACNARTEVLTGEAAAEHYALGELETRRKEAMQMLPDESTPQGPSRAVGSQS